MKPKYRNLLFSVGTALITVSFANADQIWDGGSAVDSNWNTAANWGGDTLPTFGSAITFTGNTRNTATNNLTANTTIGGINFTNDGSAGKTNVFTLSTNAITLGGNITTTANTAGTTITDIISLNMILNGNRTITTNQQSGTIQHNLTISGVISGATFGIIKAGDGVLTLSNTNTYTGATTVNAGTLRAGAAAGGQAFGSLSAVTLANTAGVILDLNGFNQTIGSLAGGGATGGDVTLGSGSAVLTIGGLNTNTSFAGIISGTGTSGLTKNGTGTQTLTGANTYAGTTTINAGTLNLGGGTANGSLTSATLTLAGGSFNYSRTGTNTQNFTTTNINSAPASVITVSSGNTLNLGTVARANGVTLDFSTGLGAGTVAAAAASNTGGIMAGFNFGDNWAVANGTGVAISGLGSYTLTSVAGTTAGNYTGFNMDVDNSAGTLGGTITTNSLRFSAAAANTLALATGTNTISTGGILVGSGVGANLSTISGGTLTGPTSKDLSIIQNNTSGGLTISSVIANNTSTSLTKSGGGLLTLGGNNTFTGGVFINAGTVALGNAGALNSTAGSQNAVTFGASSSGTLALTGTNATIANLSTNATAPGTAFVQNANGSGVANVTLTVGNSTNASGTFAGIIRDGTGGGTLALTKAGTGTLTLSGNNSYTGGTTISAGTLVANNSSAFGTGRVTISGASTTVNFLSGLTIANDIAVNAAVTMKDIMTAANAITFTGVLSGNSAISIAGNGVNGANGEFAFTNANNTWTGDVTMASGNTVGYDHFSFNSIGDGGKFTLQKSGNQNTISYTGSSNIAFNARVLNVGAINGLFDGGGANPVNMFANNGTGTVTFNTDMTVGAVTAGAALFLGGSNAGNNTFAGTIPAGSGGAFGIGKTGTGKWILTGSNSYAGETLIRNGTLAVNAVSAIANNQPLGVNAVVQLGHNGDSGTLEFTGGTNSTTDKTIRIGNSGGTQVGGGSILNNGTGSLTFNNATAFNVSAGTITATRSLTLGGTYSGTNEIGAVIQDNVANTGKVNITVTGSAWRLTKSNTYTGTTTVNNGTLVLGNGGNLNGSTTLGTAVTVASGGTLAVRQTASATANAIGQAGQTTASSLTLASNSAMNMADGFTSTLNLTGTATLAPASGTAPVLTFDIAGANADRLAITGAATVGAAKANIAISPTSTPTAGSSYTVMTALSGLNSANFALANSLLPTANGLMSLAFTGSNATTQVVAVSDAANALYWSGATDGDWSTAGNWNTSIAGGVVSGSAPTTTTDVAFSTTTPVAANLSNSLSAPLTINSLNFLPGTGAVTIGGSAITVSTDINDNSATNQTINAPISVNGNLNKTGAGTLTLAGSNTISGIVAVDGGTLRLENGNAITSTSGITTSTQSALRPANGTTIQLRADSDTIFNSGLITLPQGTLNIDVNNTLSGIGQTLTLGTASVALNSGAGVAMVVSNGASASNAITLNVTGGNGYGLALGTIQQPASAVGSTFTVNAGTVPLSINQFQTASFGNNLIVNSGTVTLGSLSQGSNSTNTLTVNAGGKLILNGATTSYNGRAGGNLSTVLNASATLVVNHASALANTAAVNAPTLIINGGTLDTTQAGGITITPGTTTTPTMQWNGDFTFTGTQNLNLGTGAVTMSATRSVTVANNTLTVGGVIAGAGLTKAGAGTLTLTGDNTYSGATTVSAGTLTLTSNRTAALGGILDVGGAGGATLNIQGNLNLGAQQFRVSNTAGAGTVNQTAGAITATGGSQFTIGTNLTTGIYNMSGGSITTAPVSNRGIIVGSGASTAFGTFNLSGTGSITVVSGSVLDIARSENTANVTGANGTFNQTGGMVTVNGALRIAGANAVNNASASGTLNLTAGTFAVTGSGTFAALAGGDSSTALINIGGTADVTLPAFPGAATRGSGATATINFDGGTLRNSAASTTYMGGLTNAFIKAGGATFNTTNGDITITQNLLTDLVSTGGGLTKQGANALTLTGTNDYTGATTVSTGSLIVNGSINSTTTVTVASGATLGGSGSVGGAITINGTLSPGTSPGQLSVANSLGLSNGSLTLMELGGDTLGTGYDNITLNALGALAYGGGLNVVNFGGYDMALTSLTYDLFSLNGVVPTGDFFSVTVNSVPLTNNLGVWTGNASGVSYLFDQSIGDLTIAIPEPNVAALLGGLGVVLLLRRRR